MNTFRKCTIVGFALAALSVSLPTTAAQKASSSLTSKEVKELVANAKTPADHAKLAAYFNLEADKLQADAKQHTELAEVYRLNPPTTGGGKSGGNPQVRSSEHCLAIAKSLTDAATNLRALGREHASLAASK
jgi:hypothetical protein